MTIDRHGYDGDDTNVLFAETCHTSVRVNNRVYVLTVLHYIDGSNKNNLQIKLKFIMCTLFCNFISTLITIIKNYYN
jgi:hypothetical protein